MSGKGGRPGAARDSAGRVHHVRLCRVAHHIRRTAERDLGRLQAARRLIEGDDPQRIGVAGLEARGPQFEVDAIRGPHELRGADLHEVRKPEDWLVSIQDRASLRRWSAPASFGQHCRSRDNFAAGDQQAGSPQCEYRESTRTGALLEPVRSVCANNHSLRPPG